MNFYAVWGIEADEDDDESYHPCEDKGIESTSTCTCSNYEDTSIIHDLGNKASSLIYCNKLIFKYIA